MISIFEKTDFLKKSLLSSGIRFKFCEKEKQ